MSLKPTNDGLNKFIESFRDGSSDRREELRIIITLLKQETRQEAINEFEKMIKSFDNRLIRELKEVKIERRNKIATEDNCDGQETILRLVRNWLNENLKEKLQEMRNETNK